MASTLLSINQDALAHADHYKTPQSEEIEGAQSTEPSPSDSASEAPPTIPAESAASTTIPAAVPATNVQRPSHFSFGIGESILGLIVLVPFCLHVLRKRLHN